LGVGGAWQARVMSLPIFVVDAFTSEAFRGNPAAVVLGHGNDGWMQRVAAEMRHSETAFVRPRDGGGFDLRWFSPEVEVDLCGHATLASAHILFETGRLAPDATARFHTRSGELTAQNAGAPGITLDFPVAVPVPADPKPELFDALGLAATKTDLLSTTGAFFMCVVESAATVRNLAPDFTKLRALTDVRGVYVTAPGDAGYDVVSRCFAPRVGIDEDPVTGSMHCVLVAYWAPRLGRDELRAFQASERGGEVTVVQKGDRALFTGRATTVLAGELRA
jgi:PhzF family phenazine biosynthesis protein